jgi:hypothetical protein
MVEIDFTSREIIREAIKLLGDAQQYLLHVRLNGEFRGAWFLYYLRIRPRDRRHGRDHTA